MSLEDSLRVWAELGGVINVIPINEAIALIDTNVCGCGDHKIDFDTSRVRGVLASNLGCSCRLGPGETCGSYCDTWSYLLLLLQDDLYAAASEWSDSSGHG